MRIFETQITTTANEIRETFCRVALYILVLALRSCSLSYTAATDDLTVEE